MRKGSEMIRLGLSYVLAGLVASAAEMAVRAYIVDAGTLGDEGLYCSGFILTVSYARFVFVSLDADYFPRLSAACNDVSRMNETINRQLEVCVLLMAPFLIFFALFLPYIIKLLFASEFLQVVPMTLCAVYYMFLTIHSLQIQHRATTHSNDKYIIIMFLIIHKHKFNMNHP